jgi:organic hydroperoxide reductase OsmC/OhrA
VSKAILFGDPNAVKASGDVTMKPLPHRYNVTLTAGEQSNPVITSDRLQPFTSAPPAYFDGPGDLWSPETLLVAAVADCFALTFRAMAKSSHLRWTKILCDADGTLDRSEGVTRFTAIDLHVWLVVPAETAIERAHGLLQKAEKHCLVGNSLRFAPTLHLNVSAEDAVVLPKTA